MPLGVVFIDYQNVYKGARASFLFSTPGRLGNVSPLKLGQLVARRARFELQQVRVYTGVPHHARDSLGHGIMQRRIAAWKTESDKVAVYERSLRYPPREGREKGVDVQLAIDFVSLALDSDPPLEALALCSADTDLTPALEFVDTRCPGIALTTVSWKAAPGGQQNEPLDLPTRNVNRIRLTQTEFNRFLEDSVDYRGGPP